VAGTDDEYVEHSRRLANFAPLENRLRRLFHVEHSFAEAKPAEQRVEHIFHPRPASQPIESSSSVAEVFSGYYDVISLTGSFERVANLGDVGRLPPIQSEFSLRRQQSLSQATDFREEGLQTLTRDGRYWERAARHVLPTLQIGAPVNTDQAVRHWSIFGLTHPQQDIS
jgi:hypothetical protein